MRNIFSIFIILILLTGAYGVHAQMSSSNYKTRWDSFSVGGDDDSGSASYQLRDTVGNNSIGSSTSANYETRGGYRAGVFDQVVTFEIFTQSNGSQTDATGLSGTTVSVASTGGFSEGDFIAIVQNEGGSQVSGIGKVTNVDGGANELTVDEITSDGALSIDGTNDYVYSLSSSSVNLGELTDSAVSTAIIGFNTSVDVDSGYTVQVFEDGDLRDGANTVDDVADGSVTAGSEEYGGISSDGDVTFGTQDEPFTSDYADVADRTENSFDERDLVTVRAAIDGTTPDGSYAHELTFIVSGNY